MKKLFIVLGGIVATLIVAIVALVLLVNPNQFKPLIVEKVAESTGQTLVIEGDLAWQFWPNLGLSLGKTALRNPEGFTETDLLSFEQASLSVEVAPLFSKHLSVGELLLDAPHVHLETLKSGVTNLDSFKSHTTQQAAADAEPTATEAPSEAAKQGNDWIISLKGIQIRDAEILKVDHQAGSRLEVKPANFTLAAFVPGEWTAFTFDLNVKADEAQASVKGQASLWLSESLDDYAMRELSVEANATSGETVLNQLTLTVDEFAFDKPGNVTLTTDLKASDVALTADLKTGFTVTRDLTSVVLTDMVGNYTASGESLPRKALKGALKGDVNIEPEKSVIALRDMALSVNEVDLNGALTLNYQQALAIRFDLHSPDIDVDAWLPQSDVAPSEKGAGESGEPSSAKESSQGLSKQEPDLSALAGHNIAGTIAVDKFKAANAVMTKVKLALDLKQSQLTISSLKAQLYKGAIDASIKLDARKTPARFEVKQSLTDVHIQPLLVDVAENDTLSGRGNVRVNVKGIGLSEYALRKNIAGTIALSLSDGAVKGFNVAEMIREARATLKGEGSNYVEEVRQTDFSAMSATLSLSKGVMSNQDLSLASPLLRVKGKGQTHLIDESIDYELDVAVVESSKGQGGKGIDELKDIIIPVSLGGTWSQPSYKLDVEALLKQNLNQQLEDKAQREIERGINKLLGDSADKEEVKDAADKLLRGLFN
ncbi:AsmA family protein [Thaumasiovibrio subtropicus]|uniref:AsmA family protein n=1 Tax=Thaumasiovibrio subtropicus TaxID=1891207 RepID=UPI000B358892|nr:AsmA family protein [Thaumasiovibrio subtropicus]